VIRGQALQIHSYRPKSCDSSGSLVKKMLSLGSLGVLKSHRTISMVFGANKSKGLAMFGSIQVI
jgi:hypothetical protein